MNTTPLGRKYALSITVAPSGAVSGVQFYSRALGFGAFADADLLDPAEPMPTGATLAIDEDRIEETLLGLILDRQSIKALPDFAQFLPVDAIGSPCVYRYELHCMSCGHDWQDALPDVAEIVPCERCRSRVEVDPHMVHWHGPPSPVLRRLWRSLPGPVGFHVEFPTGILVYPTENGLAIRSPGGQRFLLSRDDGNVSVTGIRGSLTRLQTRVIRLLDAANPGKET